ncbi:MAG: hypothetical protein AAFP03_01875 [Cyanobacteria bacterium J06598_3]
MSALTFEILSTELTLALSEQSDTPPDTTARCNLGRDKVMVLVEYPLDSAQAEPMASRTLDWLEVHLRHQFDTTGLPEEAAELAEAGEEVPVQLFLKHRSEPKPFTMRSFIWKVDDGFDDIFGNASGASQPVAQVTTHQTTSPQTMAEASGTPIFRHPSDVRADSRSVHNDLAQVSPLYEDPPAKESVKESVKESTLVPTTPTVDNVAADFSVAEPHNAGFRASELSEPVPSELDEEHLLLDLEPDIDLDFDPSLSDELEIERLPGLSTDPSELDLDELDLENYLTTPEPSNVSPTHVDLSSGSDAPLEVEAELSSVSPSPVEPPTDLGDLAAGLTYPSATPTQRTVDTGEAFDADLAAGVTSNQLSEPASTEFSLPGEAPTIASSEFDLPTVELPVVSEPETSPSGDFFTFDQGEGEATSAALPVASVGLEDEIDFSPSTPTLEDDLSVEFGLSPEEAPPAVYDSELSDAELSDSLSGAELQTTELQTTELQTTGPQTTGPQTTEPPITEPAESPITDSHSADSTTDDDELHLFDLPTADEPLSDFDLPVDSSVAAGKNQDSSAIDAIEDYLSTEELPSDDLSRGDVLAKALDSVGAGDPFEAEEDPLMAEVAAASTDAGTAGPPSLDLSPLAYHILADEIDDDEAEVGQGDSGFGELDRGDRSLAYGLEGEADSRNADGYDDEGYNDEDDSTYYLEEDDEDDEEPLEDVALIDDGEVERQRDQWQQQSKSNPWGFVGALGLVVLGVLGFVFTRPCSFGSRCDRIQAAQAQGDEAIGNLRLDASLASVNASKADLEAAIQSLKPIPVWSPHYDEAQAVLPEYEQQVDALALVTKAQGQAYQAAVDSQKPPHSVSTWNGIAEGWLAATQSLEAVPADSPVRELADRKLIEYRSNRATILVRIDAESKAEVSLRQSQQAATKATNLSQSAGTLQDWEDALAAWESAVDNLSQIPQGTNAHGEAQKILPGYLKQLEDVRDRTEQERSASRELFQAKQRAADAQRAGSEDRWTISAQHWKTALSQLQDVSEGTLSHSEAQALTGLYTSALNNAESNLQIALRFQPVEPEFFAACGTTTAQKCTYSVRGGNVRLDLFQGYDSIIDQSITPPDQRVIVPVTNDAYIAPSNQLLQAITLLSTQAQVPIELYDAKGDFLARYRPDLNGFVREQG